MIETYRDMDLIYTSYQEVQKDVLSRGHFSVTLCLDRQSGKAVFADENGENQEILENMDIIETGEYDCEPDVNDPVNVVLSELQNGNMPAEELIEDAVFRLQDIQEQEQQEGRNYYSKY